MLYREIIAVCSEIHTKHINTLCGQNVELFSVACQFVLMVLTDPETKLTVSPQPIHLPNKHNDRLCVHEAFVILISKITAFNVRTLN
jgi:hypothetical protein